ncbi:MAG: hypothetical protein PHQ52_03620 [Candidatus Omnitrophica bacterium]|nr:hypothetical protein [Candidatus Omnitrophota bacterium]
MSKKYTTPKITSVELNPEQASLQVCAVGGLYLWTMAGANTHCNSQYNPLLGPMCELTPKGGLGGRTVMIYTVGPASTEASFPS